MSSELTDHEGVLGRFFEASLDLMCIAGFDGHFIRVNHAWTHVLGWSEEELLAAPYVSFIHPDDVAATAAETVRLRDGSVTLSFENRYRRKDGDYIWLLWHATPDLDRRLIYAAARDVTQKKTLEQQLLKTSQMQQALLDGADFVIFSTDTRGVVQTFNVAAEQDLGYAPAEVIGRVTPTIFHDPAEVACHAEELSRELGRHIEPGLEALTVKAVMGVQEEREWTYIRKDGTRYPGLASVTALRDAQGNITGFLAVIRDMTDRKAAEDELQASRQRLRLALESAQIGDWELNLVTQAVRRSLRHDQIFGYAELLPEWTYAIFLEHVHPDDRSRVDRDFHECLVAGRDWYVECRIIRPDLKVRWIWARSSIFKDSSGTPATMLGMVSDITERKALEQQLVETTRLQRAILDGANFTIISGSPEGIIQTFNAAAERELGYKADEVVGKVTPEIIHDPEEVVQRSKELSAELGIHVEPGFETFVAKARLGHADENEWTYIRKDGSRYPVLLSVTALRDESGNLTGFLGVGSNISRRKRAEAAKNEVEARLHAILDHTTAVIFIKNLEGRYLLINKRWSELFHVTTAQVIGMTDHDIFPPEMALAFRENDLKVQAAQAPLILEEIAPHEDGPHTYLSVKFPLRNAAGQVDAIGGIATDITDRKLAEDELKRSNQDLEQFAYVASHDLKEPLRMISSYLQIIEKRYADQLDDECRQYFKFALDGATRLRALIDDLLVYSRVGMEGKEFAPTDCEAALNEVLENLRLAVSASNAVITRDALPMVLADPSQLRQVFQNLLANSLKFRSAVPTRLHIGCSRLKGRWRISIEDNGIGIAPEHFERIFVIFQRLHSRDQFEGTGIGLALCKKIIERHGGSMWVESEPGKGTKVFFTLGAAEELAAH